MNWNSVKWVYRAAMAALLTSAAMAQTAAAGRISGRVMDDTGAAVEGASVMAALQTASLKDASTPFHTTVWSGKDGVFTMDKLPAGKYVLCAEKRAALLLNACAWLDRKVEVTIAEGRYEQDAPVTTVKGCLLEIRLDDPQGLLQKHEGKTGENRVSVSLSTGDSRSHFGLVTTDEKGKSVEMLAPFDTPMALTVSSRLFRLADEGGREADNQTLQIPHTAVKAKGDHQKLQITVTGVRAK